MRHVMMAGFTNQIGSRPNANSRMRENGALVDSLSLDNYYVVIFNTVSASSTGQ